MDNLQDLPARYGQWRRDEPIPYDDRAEQLADIVTALLRQSVPGESIQRYDHGDARGLVYEFEGWITSSASPARTKGSTSRGSC